MDLGIKGKVALVSGGARSLGKQDCLTLAAEGCKIIVLDLNGEGAEDTAKEITAAGGTARGYAADITDRAALAEALKRAESEVGPVDICVNNAGWIYTMGQLKDMKDEDWDQNLAINLTGTYNVTNAGPPQSWADIARRVFELSGRDPVDVRPVSTDEYDAGRSSAPRPRSSVLSLDKLAATGFESQPAGDALVAYLAD